MRTEDNKEKEKKCWGSLASRKGNSSITVSEVNSGSGSLSLSFSFFSFSLFLSFLLPAFFGGDLQKTVHLEDEKHQREKERGSHSLAKRYSWVTLKSVMKQPRIVRVPGCIARPTKTNSDSERAGSEREVDCTSNSTPVVLKWMCWITMLTESGLYSLTLTWIFSFWTRTISAFAPDPLNGL